MADKRKGTTHLNKTFYTILWWILNTLFWPFYPSRCVGKENFSRESPYIIVSAHQSVIDPLLIARHNKWHKIRFLGKASLRNFFLLRWIVDGVGMIPVVRNSADIGAMRECLRVLKEKNVLCIFPEGTRRQTHELNNLASGTGLIALKSKAPLIPVYFDRKPKIFRCTTLYVGKEIPFDDLIALGTGKDVCDKLMDRISEAIIDLSKEAGKNV